MLTTNVRVNMTPTGEVINRRSFLRNVSAGAAGLGMLGWMDALRLDASELRKRGMSCILLFMRGGPSQFETFDPKPGTETGGPTKAIKTSVPGIEIAENWPKLAQQMEHVALIRSMTSKEGNHQRAVYQLHTGYQPSGSIKHPSLGSVISCEIGDPNLDIPSYVSVGQGGLGDGLGSGYLGTAYSPFVVANPNQMPLNTTLPGGVDAKRLQRRLGLLNKLERDFAEAGGSQRVEDHRNLYKSATQLVLSPRLKAFDLSQEKESVRDRYGRSAFGQGCLLARKLVESGVTFVEVGHGNWDTHDDNFNRVKTLSTEVDNAFATLIQDLRDSGQLDKTLIVWMGEFGRTPNINPRTGRDHYPRCFNVALAGGGIKGGRVIGKTDRLGRAVEERPVEVADLFCTFCQALKINPRKENMSGVGRPMKIVDGGQPVKELFA